MEEVERLDEDLLRELEWLANSTVIRVMKEKTVEFDGWYLFPLVGLV